jgi:hypothetical protein
MTAMSRSPGVICVNAIPGQHCRSSKRLGAHVSCEARASMAKATKVIAIPATMPRNISGLTNVRNEPGITGGYGYGSFE